VRGGQYRSPPHPERDTMLGFAAAAPAFDEKAETALSTARLATIPIEVRSRSEPVEVPEVLMNSSLTSPGDRGARY
jgi:hypothetical protein